MASSRSNHRMLKWFSRDTKWSTLTSSWSHPRPTKIVLGCSRTVHLKSITGWTRSNLLHSYSPSQSHRVLISTWLSRRVLTKRSSVSSFTGWEINTLIVNSVPCKTTSMSIDQSKLPRWWLISIYQLSGMPHTHLSSMLLKTWSAWSSKTTRRISWTKF